MKAPLRLLALVLLCGLSSLCSAEDVIWTEGLKRRDLLLQIEQQHTRRGIQHSTRQGIQPASQPPRSRQAPDWLYLQWFQPDDTQNGTSAYQQLDALFEQLLGMAQPEHWTGWHQQLLSWQAILKAQRTNRVIGRMDPEWLLGHPEINRPVAPGEQVRVCQEPAWIEVWSKGAVARLPADKINSLEALSIAQPHQAWNSREWLWIVYPDGQYTRIGTAYWNQEDFRRLPAGSRVWPETEFPFMLPPIDVQRFNALMANAIAQLPFSDQCQEWHVTPSTQQSTGP